MQVARFLETIIIFQQFSLQYNDTFTCFKNKLINGWVEVKLFSLELSLVSERHHVWSGSIINHSGRASCNRGRSGGGDKFFSCLVSVESQNTQMRINNDDDEKWPFYQLLYYVKVMVKMRPSHDDEEEEEEEEEAEKPNTISSAVSLRRSL